MKREKQIHRATFVFKVMLLTAGNMTEILNSTSLNLH